MRSDPPLPADDNGLIACPGLVRPTCPCSATHTIQSFFSDGEQMGFKFAFLPSGVRLNDLGPI